MKRALLVCPGRGSYDRAQLGQLQDRSEAARAVVAVCDAYRAQRGLPTVTALDGAERYSNRLHVAGEHASLLTAACSLADAAELDRTRYEVVGVVGNSMGFYTALAVAGALPIEDAVRLIDTMGAYQEANVQGGQILYPLVDEAWRPSSEMRDRIEVALRTARDAGHGAWWSIDLGSYAVLGGDEEGCRHLLAALPPEIRGPRTFPVRLPLHSAFHTPLLADTSRRALDDLDDLQWRAPHTDLVDGRGVVHRPLRASPSGLRDYTLGAQVVDTFDFRAAVRTALHHCGPEVVVALGPGNALGGPLAALLVQDGWGGVRSRAALEARQADDPVLLSFGLPDQRARLTG